MRRKFTFFNLWLHVIALAVTMNFAFAAKTIGQDSTLIRKNKNTKASYLKNGLPFSLPPLKPGVVSTTKFKMGPTGKFKADGDQQDKLLSNVQVYPNPVTDQPLNVSYAVSRNTNVTIKIVDVLGNDLVTIFSQRVESGDQKFSYSLNNKLSRGFYFVRIMAGTESTIKRLSVL